MLIDSKRARSPANQMAFMKRDLSPADLRAVRRGVGEAVRTLYSDVLREEIPNRITELLRQLDRQLRQLGQKGRAGHVAVP
jgi:Anti-sigma factor NepR